MNTHLDQNGSMVREMSDGERFAWNGYLSTIAAARAAARCRDLICDGPSLAVALDKASDRHDRLSQIAERRGKHEAAKFHSDACLVLWHAAAALDPRF